MSKIEVNTIDTQCGTALQVGCTNTTTIGLGKSGDTITVPAGATIQNLGTATGFGGSGVVSWETASIKTTGFTAVTGTGYFCNTTGGSFTVTLPLSPTAGDVVGVADYAQNFATANLILGRNGSNIGGQSENGTISTQGVAVTLVYVDATKGWIVTDSGLQSYAPGALFMTGSVSGACNTLVTDGDYKVATFLGPGTFTVCSVGNPAGSDAVDYLVIAGGGGGGGNGGAGGGAGGYREATTTYSPVPARAIGVAMPVSVTGYPISIGGGGSKGSFPTCAVQGGSSSFNTITSAGGGFGKTNNTPPWSGGSGGSGGGSRAVTAGGVGDTPPVTPPQGNDGGAGLIAACTAAGGGGAGGVGGDTPTLPGGNPAQIGGQGGLGLCSSITGSTVPRASGATGGGCRGVPGVTFPSPPGGAGNGGTGGGAGGTNGTSNTGGGGGGGGNYSPNCGGIGGSGIVIIRYKFQ